MRCPKCGCRKKVQCSGTKIDKKKGYAVSCRTRVCRVCTKRISITRSDDSVIRSAICDKCYFEMAEHELST